MRSPIAGVGSLIPTLPFVQFFVAFVHKINLADVCRVNDYGKVADKIRIYANVWRQLLENLDELGWTYPFASVVFHGGDGMGWVAGVAPGGL
jgi:hypothetical protein